MDKGIRILTASLFTAVIWLFLAVFYCGHIRMMEFGGMFLFSREFIASRFLVPGGVTQCLYSFILQFFHVPALGALLVAALLTGMALMLYKMCRTRTTMAFLLSFLPSLALLSIFVGSNNAQQPLVTAVATLLSLALAVPLRRSSPLLAALVTPAAYYIVGPLSFIIPLTLLPSRRDAALPALAAYLLCAVATYFLYLPSFAYVLLDFNLSADALTSRMWTGRIVPIALAVLVAFLPSFSENVHQVVLRVISALVIALTVILCYVNYNGDVERVCRYDVLLQDKDWDGILEMAGKKAPLHFEEVTCTDLALAMKGRLEEDLFKYPQGGPSAFVTPFSTAISPLYAAEVYMQLGMYPTAQRYVFEAQVSGFVGEANARCHRMLAEINAALGFSAVAQKYADELSQTLFYRSWAREFDCNARSSTLADSLDYNLYYIDGNFGDVVAKCLKTAPGASLARSYMLCWYLLSNDIESFAANFDASAYKSVPTLYQQAYVLYWAQHHNDFSGLPDYISGDIAQGLMEFAAARGQNKSQTYLKRHFGNTYWFYAFYSHPQ